MPKTAAFPISESEHRQLKAAAKYQGKSVAAFMRDCVWPHVERITEELEHADEIREQIRAEYKAGGVTVEDLCTLYNKTLAEVRGILLNAG
jgi:hypothetical protein